MAKKISRSKIEKSFFRRNGLLVVFTALAIVATAGQAYTGWHEHNDFLKDHGAAEMEFARYLVSGHFIQATFENWESEFLQMALFVVLTISLYQKGSSESKDLDKVEDVDRPTKDSPKAPWPVHKGGWILKLYENSLTISLLLLFVLSFAAHFYGSLKSNNVEMVLEHKPVVGAWEYISGSRFWFESFQNWQSEFMSIAAIVFLSIYLRQKGSPQSKPVSMPHDETE